MRERFRFAVATLARFLVPNICQAGGLALVALGLYVLAPWLGIVAAGVALCVVGWAIDGGSS